MTTPTARKPLKRKKRSKSERERIYGPPGYVEWIHEQPCIACGVVGYSEVAHIQSGGTGRKDDWTRAVPLCGIHHRLLHQEGRMWFERAYNLNLGEYAAEVQSRWLTENPKSK